MGAVAVRVQIRATRLSGSLFSTKTTTYRPRHDPAALASIEIGYNVQDLSSYGVNIYHNSRLIVPFKRLPVRDSNPDAYRGVVAVVRPAPLLPTTAARAPSQLTHAGTVLCSDCFHVWLRRVNATARRVRAYGSAEHPYFRVWFMLTTRQHAAAACGVLGT